MAKVLFITNDAWFLVSHRLPIAKAYVLAGGESVVAAKEDATVAAIKEAGVGFVPWNIDPRGKTLLGELRTLFSLFTIIRQQKPDIVHLITIKPVLYGGVLTRLLKVPSCVYAIAGLGSIIRSSSTKEKVLRAIISPFYRFAIAHPNSVLIFQNPDDKRQLLKRFGNSCLKTQIIRGSGVDTNEYPEVVEPQGTPVVTLAARLLRDKGIGEFVAAATQLQKEGVVAKFQVAGGNVAKGAPGAFSDTELEVFQASDTVDFIGHCDDIPTLFSRSSIIVLPSYYPEGLPKVLIEASAARRPIVTTDMPGCRDAVIDGKTGLIVPPKDAQALAQAIKRLLADKQLRQQMGEAGRALVEQEMSIEIVVDQHLTIYGKLLSDANKTSMNRG